MSEVANPNTAYYPFIPLITTPPSSSIPSCATWFDLLGIHKIEREALPEYFRDHPTRTPENYMKFRNYIINEYRQNPQSYLSATACRKRLAGDAYSVVRIHSFLENWGLINFHAPKPYSTAAPDFVPPGHMSYYRRRVFELLRPFCEVCGFLCDVVWFVDSDRTYCRDCSHYGSQLEQRSLQDTYGNLEVDESCWTEEKERTLLVTLRDFGDDWERAAAATGATSDQCIAKYLDVPLEKMIAVEDEKPDDYESPLYNPIPEPPLAIDVNKAIEKAKALKRQEEVYINNGLNKLIELQLKKLQLKSKFIQEMDKLMNLEACSYRLKLQQLYMKQFALLPHNT